MYFFFVVKNDQPLTQLVCMYVELTEKGTSSIILFHVCCE